MGITVVPVSMSDFRVLASLEICTMAYFEASWTNKRRAYYSRNSILNSLADFDGVLPVLFHITVYGSDDAEDFVINRLASTALPALAIFSVGLRTEFTGAIDSGGALNDPYFCSNLRRVIELYPKTLIESPTDRNEKSDTTLTEESTFDSGNFDEASRLNLETLMSLVFEPSDKSSTTDDLCVSNGKECSKIGGYSSSKNKQQNSSEAMTGMSDSEALILFVAGDKSSVGKSSICLAILASLVRLGADPSLIAYIKPITQCEADQPVTDYCTTAGISHRGIGPVVFYKGFTRAFLKGETPSAEILLKSAVDAVKQISFGKRIVIVDGVGYPSVGSICELSNAHVAQALGAPVLLVGKSGVGDAVDSFNINTRYFESYGVQVLGCVFNKLPLEGFYNVQACKEAVSSYFTRHGSVYCPYGFIPILAVSSSNENAMEMSVDGADPGSIVPTSGNETIKAAPAPAPATATSGISTAKAASPTTEALVDAFLHHVDFNQLLCDIFKHHISSTKMILRKEDGFLPYVHLLDDNMKNQRLGRVENDSRDSNGGITLLKDYQPSIEMKFNKREREKETLLPSAKIPAHVSTTSSSSKIEIAPKTRQEIEAGAYSAGAVKSS